MYCNARKLHIISEPESLTGTATRYEDRRLAVLGTEANMVDMEFLFSVPDNLDSYFLVLGLSRSGTSSANLHLCVARARCSPRAVVAVRQN